MKGSTCEIVSIDWLLESISEEQPLDAEEFSIERGSRRSVSATSESTSQSHRKRKTRSESIDSDDESTEQVNDNESNAESQRKRESRSASRSIENDGESAEQVIDSVLANLSTLSAMVDKASHKAEEGKCRLLSNDVLIVKPVILNPFRDRRKACRPQGRGRHDLGCHIGRRPFGVEWNSRREVEGMRCEDNSDASDF
jgi:hypothetical protein